MSKKLTPWFPAHVKPVRIGFYDVASMQDRKWRAYWDGSKWCFRYNLTQPLFLQHREWRGLASDPEAL